MDFPVAVVCVAMIGFVAFYQWLRHQRRVLQSRERVAAIEKGIALPEDGPRPWFNVERILLLAGLCWISVGVAMLLTLNALLAYSSPAAQEIPQGIQWVGLGPVGIGLSHLVVYLVGRGQRRG